ncbi:MAG: GNAT family N-acetyltransferase [Terriglobia bacterium]
MNVLQDDNDGSLTKARPADQEPVWGPERDEFPLSIGGWTLARIELSALAMTTHFTRLSTRLEETAPAWKEFPAGIEAAVIRAQPVDRDHKRLVFLPASIRTVGSTVNWYYVKLEGTFEEYLEKFKGKARKNLVRTVKKFGEFSGSEIEWAQYSPSEIETFCALADEVNSKSWQAKVSGSFRDWVGKSRILDWAAEGKILGYVLFHQGRPIAVACCKISQDVFYYWAPRFDQAYEKWSPGTVLLYLILEKLFAEGKYKLFDFGEGLQPYKEFFSTGCVPCATVRYFKRTAKHTVFLTGSHLAASFSLKTGILLEKLGIKKMMKRVMLGERARPGSV